MRPLAWAGIILVALAILAYVVLRVTIWFAVALFAAGVVLLFWGAVKVKRAL